MLDGYEECGPFMSEISGYKSDEDHETTKKSLNSIWTDLTNGDWNLKIIFV